LLTPPLLASVIGDSRYAIGFAIVAIFPLLAVPVTPARAETRPKAVAVRLASLLGQRLAGCPSQRDEVVDRQLWGACSAPAMMSSSRS